jgi:hypothetical protein
MSEDRVFRELVLRRTLIACNSLSTAGVLDTGDGVGDHEVGFEAIADS